MQRSFAFDNSRFFALIPSPLHLAVTTLSFKKTAYEFDELLQQVIDSDGIQIRKGKPRTIGPADLSYPLLRYVPLKPLAMYYAATRDCKKVTATKDDIETIQYFQGIGLIDDFYLSLVSWSAMYGCRSVALGPNLYLWGGHLEGIEEIKLERYGLGHLTCVAYSSSDILLMCTIRGLIAAYSQKLHRIVATTSLGDNYICCATWLGNSNFVFVGSDKGVVMCLYVSERSIIVKKRLFFHTQQICGKFATNVNFAFTCKLLISRNCPQPRFQAVGNRQQRQPMYDLGYLRPLGAASSVYFDPQCSCQGIGILSVVSRTIGNWRWVQ